MAQAFFINAPKRKWSRDWTKKHKRVGTVRAHKRHVNPKTNRRRGSAKRRRFSPAQLAAQRKFATMARQRAAGARKARRSSVAASSSRRTGGTMARRKRRRSAAGTTKRRRRRRSVVRANPRRRRRRTLRATARRRRVRSNPRRRRARGRYRRNPGIAGGARGLVSVVVQGAKDGFMVTLGRGLTKMVSTKIPFGQTSTVGQSAVQLIVGTALAMAVKKVARSDRAGAMFLAGAYSNVIQTVLAPIPVLGPALSGVASWPRLAGNGVSAWPHAVAALPAPGPSNSSGVGQPWGFDSANLSDGIMS